MCISCTVNAHNMPVGEGEIQTELAHSVMFACTLLERDPQGYRKLRFVTQDSIVALCLKILKLRAFMEDTAFFFYPLNCNLVCMAAAFCSVDGQRYSVKHMLLHHLRTRSFPCISVYSALPAKKRATLKCILSLALNLTLLPAGRTSVQDNNSMFW